jgi:hypothetical protein
MDSSQNRHRMKLPWWCSFVLLLLKVPAVAADEDVACVCGDSNAGGRRNLEGRAFPSLLSASSRPALCFFWHASSCSKARKPDPPPRANLSREASMPNGSPSSCVSALSNTLLHFASGPRRPLGTYLYITMPALPEDIASLLTCGARCWPCNFHVICDFHQSLPTQAIHSAPDQVSDPDLFRPIAHPELRTTNNNTMMQG